MRSSGWGVATLLLAFTGLAHADVSEQCYADREHGAKLRSEHALRGAMYSFRACSALECPDTVRDECASAYDAVAAEMPSIVVAVYDAHGAALTRTHVIIDGGEAARTHGAFVVDPGPHTVRVDGIDGIEQRVTVGDGDHKRLVFASTSIEPHPLWRSAAWPWLVTSVGATGLVAGTLLTSIAYAMFPGAVASCPDSFGCDQSENLKQLNHAGIGVLVGASVVTAIGVVWLVLHPRQSSSTSLALTLARGAVAF